MEAEVEMGTRKESTYDCALGYISTLKALSTVDGRIQTFLLESKPQ